MANKKYYIYHIPEQKIGMTCDLYKRVHKQQGYKPGEYEILFETNVHCYVGLTLEVLWFFFLDCGLRRDNGLL